MNESGFFSVGAETVGREGAGATASAITQNHEAIKRSDRPAGLTDVRLTVKCRKVNSQSRYLKTELCV